MRILAKIGAFLLLFVLFLLWRFPYESLVDRAIRQAELATGSTILYQHGGAGPFGVKVKDLHVRMASGASFQFDSARIFPTRSGLKATAYQGENEMKVNFNGTQLQVELSDITADTGSSAVGVARASGKLDFGVRTREGEGTLRLVVPEIGLPLPIDKSVEIGSTFVIKNVGTPEAPITGVSAELKMLSSDGNSTANGTVSLEGQPPPSPPLLNGNLRYEAPPMGRGTLKMTGTWEKPAVKVIRK